MTTEQKSKQASQNAAHQRVAWQREATRCKAIMAERQAAIDKMGAEITRLCGRLAEVRTELQASQKECRMMRRLVWINRALAAVCLVIAVVVRKWF